MNRSNGIFFRHRTWEADRRRVLGVLDSGDFPADRFRRFAGCGEQAVVFQDPMDPERFKVGCNRCHDRFCLPCAQDRARLIAANLKAKIPQGKVRFLTLTLKHNRKPLLEQIDRLYDSFAKLRRRKLWTQRVTGGAAFLEVKLSRDDGLWHPHLHVMLQGGFLPQAAVSQVWKEITGDSWIVDIRLAKSPESVARYLASYVTKGWSAHVYHDPEKLKEILLALVGRKLVATFGAWSKIKLLEPPEAETWEALGTLQELIDLARAGDQFARHVLTIIHAPEWVPPLVECHDTS